MKDVTQEFQGEELAEAFVRLAEKAVNGTLTDAERVVLFRLGFTVVANELHRIEEEYGEPGEPAVNTKVLLILQQIGLITQGTEPELSKLVNPMTGENFKLEGDENEEGPDDPGEPADPE